MKSGQKPIGFLLILIGLISNPWLFSLLFSNDGEITTITVFVGVILIEILIVILGVSVWVRGQKLLINIGLIMLSTWLTIAFLVFADRTYGRFLMPETANLLFPAFSKAEHHTSEFDLNVKVNNLGFRGPNTTFEKNRKRVLLIGDSFTFGWGVEEQKTWIHLLSVKYPNIEFLNLGQGGNHPGDYVQVAKKVIPVLRPNLVIVGILQGNDIHQLMRVIEFEESGKTFKTSETGRESTVEKLRRYSSLIFLYFTKRFSQSVSIQKKWKQDAKKVLSELDDHQVEKYETIDSQLKKDFESGLLNPSLIFESIHHPNWMNEAADTANTLCQMAIIRLRDHLSELKDITEKHSSGLMVINIPNRPYGFPSEIAFLEELGFEVIGSDTLSGNLPIEVACQEANVLEVQPIMEGDSLFYPYDGHWNVEGNRIFAKQLINKLDSLPKWKHFLTS